ncbi:MAG: asparagine synthase (glutamine-hydrolyzing) [Pseudorhodoplanes sp.]
MSGIAGIIHFDGRPAERSAIENMTNRMSHRGPDGINHWINGSVALGHCMLHTTPESLEETQPLTNEDESLALVMDGRVDNWEELRTELLSKGATLRTRADAELVLRAYEFWGQDCVAHLNGDFALMMWDSHRREAFCARDRLGNKPFNYHWDGKTFAFASELHTLLSLPWVSQIQNEGVIAEFLANDFYSRDETIWLGIRRLVAAHRMVVSPGALRIEKYWSPDLWATLPYTRDDDFIQHYRELIFDIVRRKSRSHRPVACGVSGGLDSSSIFCTAKHLSHSGALPAPDIAGYALSFPEDEMSNELEYSREVGAHLGLKIQEISPSLLPFSWYQQRAQFEREFPGYPNGPMSLDLSKRAQTQGARVMLTGVGGDEWLGDAVGRRAYFVEELVAGRWRSWWTSLVADCRDYGSVEALGLLLRYGLAEQLPKPLYTTVRSAWRALRGRRHPTLQFLSNDFETLLSARRELHRSSACSVQHIGQAAQLLVLSDSYSAWAIESEDRMAARIGLELRHPMRDSALIAFSFALPSRLLIRGRTNKYIHVRAMEGILPEKVRNRTSKAEFSVVFRHHIGSAEEELDEILRRRKRWLNVEQVRRIHHMYKTQSLNDCGIGIGRAQWLLSGVLGCDALCDSL